MINVLRQIEGGRRINNGCRELAVSEQTYPVGKENTQAWD